MRRPLKLHSNIVAELRSMILRCVLVPGSRISEKELCARFDVSRTPLREALKMLAVSGLVDLLPNRGAWVPQLRADAVAEAFDVLVPLECWAGHQAASLMSDRDLRDLTILHGRLSAQIETSNAERSIRTDFEFHRKFVEAGANRTLADIHEGLAIRVERARYIVGMSRARMGEAVAEHAAILHAITARDPVRVSEEVKRHCLNTRDAVMEALRTRFDFGLRAGR